jgi:hypothetical protein
VSVWAWCREIECHVMQSYDTCRQSYGASSSPVLPPLGPSNLSRVHRDRIRLTPDGNESYLDALKANQAEADWTRAYPNSRLRQVPPG